jgi:hypothetical protein
MRPIVRTVAYALVAVAVLGVTGTRARSAQSAATPASPEIEAFVRAALQDRFAADDIPDLSLARAPHRIGIRREMGRAHLLLSDSALPSIDGYEFFLQPEADAQAIADARNSGVLQIVVDEPRINGDAATISIGTDQVLPRDPNLVKLCCCTATLQFHRVKDRWTFVRSIAVVCS